MVKYGKMQKVVMSALVTMLIASFLLAIVAIVLPTPAMALGCGDWWLTGGCCDGKWRWRRDCTEPYYDPQFGWTIRIWFEYKCQYPCPT